MQEYEDLQTDERTGDTGPLVMRMKRRGWNPLNWIPRADPQPHDDEQEPVTITRRPAPVPENDFTRQRRAIEQFSEDYMPLGKRALHGAARLVGYLLPLLAVLAVGSDLGAFYAPGLGRFSSYLLSFAIESAIAALTIVLGTAAASPERTTAHKVKLGVTAAIWLLCQVGSALSLYVMATSVMSNSIVGPLWYVTIAWRVCSTAALDLASIAILFWAGKSLQRYLSEMRQKTHAIVQLSDAEIDIRRAMQRADLRAKEDEMEMRARELRAAHLLRLDEARNQRELERLGIVESRPSLDERQSTPGLRAGHTSERAQMEYSKAPQTTPPRAHTRGNSRAQRARRSTAQIDSVLDALERAKPGQSARALARAAGVSVSSVDRWKKERHS